MTAEEPRRSLSKRVVEELQTQALRIKAAVSALRLWERVLTESERQRLGGDVEALYRRHGTAGIWMRLRGVSAERAVVDVAQALGFLEEGTARWLLRELGEADEDPEATLKKAIASGALVLVERPRSAYWQGRTIAVDWEKRPALWEFFWELCQHAKSGRPLDPLSLGSSAHRDVVTKQKARLAEQPEFPGDLVGLMRPVGRGTQKLDLPPERIRLFELIVGDSLREWTA